MKHTWLFVALFTLSLGFPLSAQTKAVHFKKLQEFLPTMEIPGLERKKPTGQTQSSMGMTTSEAKVRYVTRAREGEEAEQEAAAPEISIEVIISDMSGVPFGTMAAMAYQQEFENESEDGYEKTVTVGKTYKGKESARTGDYKNCALEFAVGARFIVKIEANNTDDVKLLHSLAGSMELAKLESTKP